MKILFIDWESYGNQDIKEAFLSEGHCVVDFSFTFDGKLRHNPETELRLYSVLHQEVPDAVFSFNYFPVISKVCQSEGIRYIAWVYDSPAILLYSCTIVNPCNTIYVFDKEVYLEFHCGGIQTVHYMPMAVNVERLDRISEESLCNPSYSCDVSFVGSLYTERWNFYDQMTGLRDYARGYLDALMAAQMKVQGYNFIQEVLAPVMGDLQKAFPMSRNEDGVESMEWFYAQYLINRKITSLERADLLTSVAGAYGLDLFTYDPDFSAPGLRNHGGVDYDYEMPKVFRDSKINLNISLRSIKSGIPLRAFDIMGSGGFLLSSFQADFLDFFVPGEDFVFYESKEDLLQKIGYYLEHEEERRDIAQNGHDKVSAEHTYRHRVREMLDL